MQNKQKNILIWILIGSGVVLLVLYSPLGSPEIYTDQNNYVVTAGVNFENKRIQNAPKAEIISDYTKDKPDFPVISNNGLKPTNYSIGNLLSENRTSPASVYPLQSQLFQSNNFFESHGSPIDNIRTFIVSGRFRTNTGASGSVMVTGITALSLSTRLSSSEDLSDLEGGDPGGNPTSPPIPVGNGYGMLVLYGACYAAYKIHHSVSGKGKSPHKH